MLYCPFPIGSWFCCGISTSRTSSKPSFLSPPPNATELRIRFQLGILEGYTHPMLSASLHLSQKEIYSSFLWPARQSHNSVGLSFYFFMHDWLKNHILSLFNCPCHPFPILGIEPTAWCMLYRCSTSEIYPYFSWLFIWNRGSLSCLGQPWTHFAAQACLGSVILLSYAQELQFQASASRHGRFS